MVLNLNLAWVALFLPILFDRPQFTLIHVLTKIRHVNINCTLQLFAVLSAIVSASFFPLTSAQP